MNHLLKEKSPYLKQHADNPVDWYPWGEEAFAKARAEDKPIFLSIGYSTCHWCHVMAHESFENPGIAKVLNELYVSVKVDREERPDIDAVYMKAVMALTGRGGWPLSAFLTPDLKPFYGGTYFPPEDRWGHPGFMKILTQLHDKWKNSREMILNAGKQLTEVLTEASPVCDQNQTAPILTEAWMALAYERMLQTFDSEDGGFGGAPKFPRTHALDLLLAYHRQSGDAHALEMVEKTLQAMAMGGIYDHLGGGFHRYSVDAYWHVPHFEKMLYDQALIAKTYLAAYAVTKNSFYADTARTVFEYVARDLTSPEDAFYSAEDADSLKPNSHEKSEGAFYVWSEKEIRAVLNPEEADLFCWAYGVQVSGNVRQDPHAEFTELNVLFRAYPANDLAARFQKTAGECEAMLSAARQKLFQIQKRRSRPHRDEKILTDWNALMIGTLALGGRILNEPRWIQAAQKAFQFLKANLKRPDGRWLHRFAEGESAILAFLEDYAFLAQACLELYQATFEIQYLQEAYFLGGEIVRLFNDTERGGFHLSSKDDGEELIAAFKELYDGAMPSGNGAAVSVLIQLGIVFGKKEWIGAAEKAVRFFYGMIERDPSAFPVTLLGLHQRSSKEIFVSGDKNLAETQAMLALSREQTSGVFWIFQDGDLGWLNQVLPAACERFSRDGKPAAFLCQNQTCHAPIFNARELKALL